MMWTVLLNILLGLTTLAFAAFMLTKTNEPFQAAAFVAALIAYRRMMHGVSLQAGFGIRHALRMELWFHQLNRQLRLLSPKPVELPQVLEEVEFSHSSWSTQVADLEDLKSEVERSEQKARIFGYSTMVVDVLLVLLLIFQLLR